MTAEPGAWNSAKRWLIAGGLLLAILNVALVGRGSLTHFVGSLFALGAASIIVAGVSALLRGKFTNLLTLYRTRPFAIAFFVLSLLVLLVTLTTLLGSRSVVRP